MSYDKNKIPLKAFLPNYFTAFNIISGFTSLVLFSENYIFLSAVFLTLSSVFDVIDGFLARYFNASSRLGIELDSLADIVSFGVTPAYMIYYSLSSHSKISAILIATVYLVSGAFRLARYNLQSSSVEKTNFKGLPIPTAALTTVYLICLVAPEIEKKILFQFFLLVQTTFISLLMVSEINYFSLATLKNLPPRRKMLLGVLIIPLILIVIITSGIALYLIFFSIILFGIFKHLNNQFVS